MTITTPPKLGAIIERVLLVVNENIFGLASILLVVFLVIGGWYRLTGVDSPEKVKRSNATIMWAIIGYILVMASVFIIRQVAQILGYNQPIQITL